jgi:hypothetical protein
MFKQKYFISILILLFAVANLIGYGPNFVFGEIIITLDDNFRGQEAERFEANFSRYNLREIELLSERSNTRLFSFNRRMTTEYELLPMVLEDENVVSAMLNYYLEKDDIEEFDNVEVVMPDGYISLSPNEPNDYYYSW